MLGSSKKVKSSGKRNQDALMELSFVLPVPANAEGMKLAEHFVKQHRFNKIEKISAMALNETHTQFRVLAESSQSIKVPQESKKPAKNNETSEYDQIISRATAHVPKLGQRKERRAVPAGRQEEVAVVKIELAPEMASPQKTEGEQKPKRRFRPRRRRGRRSHPKNQTPAQPGATTAGEVKDVQPSLAKPITSQES